MGGTTSTQSAQQQQTASSPYAPTQPMLQSIINSLGGLSTSPTAGQTAAVNTLTGEAAAIPNFGDAGTSLVSSLLGADYSPYSGLLSNAYNNYGNTINNVQASLTGANNTYGNLIGGLGGLQNTYGGILGNAGSLYNSVPGAYAPVTSAYSSYLNPNYTNPYTDPALSSAMSTMNQDITNQINGQFAAAGRSGSPGNTQALARGLSQGEGGLLANEYNALVGQQQGAISGLGGILGQQQGLQTGLLGLEGGITGAMGSNYGQQGALNSLLSGNYGLQGNLAGSQFGTGATTATDLASLLGAQYGTQLQGLNAAGTASGLYTTPGQAQLTAATSGYGLPYQDISMLESLINPVASLGGQYAGTGTGTTYQTSPWYTTAIGGALLGASLLSDRRTKRDIKQIGETFDGLPIYLFRYIGDPVYQIGLMAQDVEKVCPDAVVEMGGIKAVNYDLATRHAQRIGGRQ